MSVLSRVLRRRRFLQVAVSAAATGAAGCGGRSSPWRFFTVQEAETSGAICERIIPADQDPGASSTGVLNYIDLQLMGPLKKHRRLYRQGLAGVEDFSYARFGKRFAALAASEQDVVLAAIETKPFFELIRDHSMQGFYGDPRHGGNREYASWRMLDVPPAPIRGRQRYDRTS
jgi:gluconate 2-dehydrogenase gamma chain